MRTASRAAQRLPCDFRQIGDRVWERHIRQWKATGTRRRSSFDSRWGFHRRGGDIPWEKRPLNQSGEASSRFSFDNQARRRLLRNRERATTYGAESVGRNFWESQVSSIGARRRIWPSKRQFWNRHGSSVGFQGGKKRRLTEVGGGDFLSVPIITDEFVIESKFFQFKVIDSASIRISETKEGISSILDLDFARLTYLVVS
ncbi:unnamed protein product [Cuscuta epithymum]|uniref:Uncharacterized protein n=1 Tax=Cuscuta epithymum TaxID=186058 RepID=A0AAV0DSM2_9ASTE|nr:unnamed protein product [Cuscuta epithymum]